MSLHAESYLQGLQRHVLKNAARIARQRRLIAKFKRDENERMLPAAERRVRFLEDAQCHAEEHVAREQTKSKTQIELRGRTAFPKQRGFNFESNSDF